MALGLAKTPELLDAYPGASDPITVGSYAMQNGSAGLNRKLIIVGWCYARTNPTLTYNGETATQIVEDNGGSGGMRSVFAWYLDDADLPTDTSSHDVVLTFGENELAAAVLIFEFVDATQGAAAASAADFGSAATDCTVNITGANDSAYFVAGYARSEGGIRQLTAYPGTEQFIEESGGASGFCDTYQGVLIAGASPAASTDYTWTCDYTAMHSAAIVELTEDVVSGGTDYPVSESDGAESGDTVSGVAAFEQGVTDGATASDSHATVMAVERALSDGTVASEDITTSTTVDDGAEGAVSSDAISPMAALAQTITDGAVSADSVAVDRATFGALANGVSASDVIALAVAFGINITDGAVSGDAANTGAVAGVSDGAAASDAIGTVLDLRATASGGAVASDSIGTALAWAQSITDGADTSDTVAAQIAVLAALSDGATAGDTPATVSGSLGLSGPMTALFVDPGRTATFIDPSRTAAWKAS